MQCLLRQRSARLLGLVVVVGALNLAGLHSAHAQGKPTGGSGDAQVARAVGVIRSISGDTIVLTPDSGGEVTAKLSGSTKILRVPPGEKDLKNATPLQAQDLQPGDRVLVRGQISADGHAIAALAVIVMKQADVSAKQQRDREDWQKRGVDGLVNKVDAATGTITISSGGFGANRDIAVRVRKDTTLRRYAPDSVKFDDARPAPLDQIQVGDQLRARGTRSPDGSELSAEGIVSGTFRNIKGTITAIDAANNTMTVQDLIAKGAVVVRISSDSQMKKLPAEMAQRIAARLKGSAGANGNHEAAGGQNASAPASIPPGGGARRWPQTPGSREPGGAQGANGPPDLQRLLSRLPNRTLADLQKGEAVLILSTQGGDSGTVTAIQLVAGVEPILIAAPSQSASTILSPWSLTATGGEGEAAQ